MVEPGNNIFPLDSRIGDTGHVISLEEAQQVLVDFNNTKTDYPKEKSIDQLLHGSLALKAVGPRFVSLKITHKQGKFAGSADGRS